MGVSVGVAMNRIRSSILTFVRMTNGDRRAPYPNRPLAHQGSDTSSLTPIESMPRFCRLNSVAWLR
jgi:hypothetical protein